MSDGRQEIHDESQIHDLLRRGILTGDNLFWRQGMLEWRPLRELPAPAPTTVSPSHSKAASAWHSDDDEDDPPYKFQFMHRVRFLRLVAAAFDLFMLLAPSIIILLFGWFIFSHDTIDRQPDFWFFFGVGLYYIGLVITQLALTFSGRSLGKNFFGLRVVDIDTNMTRGFRANALRLVTHGSFGLIPFCLLTQMSPDILYAAIIYTLIDAFAIFYDDRCIHDYIAGTTVVQRSLY